MSIGSKINGYFVRFHTKGDNKDAGDKVSVTVTRLTDGAVLASKDEIGHKGDEWQKNTDQPSSDDAQWGGVKGWFRLDNGPPSITHGTGAKVTIAKTDANGWKFTWDLMITDEGDATQYITFNSGEENLHGDQLSITRAV